MNKEERKPWGYYKILAEDKNYKIKNIIVNPGKRLSLQRHKKRSEHWFIIHGNGKMMLDDNSYTVTKGESVNIPEGSFHRIENIGETDLSFIEVQTGDYFGEDDIERIEDDYGRIGTRNN